MNASVKSWIFRGYLIIGLLFTLYQHFWGPHSYKSFAYHLGQGVIWPAVMFPSVGKFIGGFLLLIFIGMIALRSK